MSDTRFWNSVERLEADLIGSNIDEKTFRAKMRRKRFDEKIIDERVAAIREDQIMIYGVSTIVEKAVDVVERPA